MEALFKQYATAWDASNPKAIAELYCLPCATADSDGVQTFSQRAALIIKLDKNCRDMQSFGYKQAKFNILNEQPLAKGQVAVTIGWLIETAHQNIEFRTLYICHQIEQTWYIFSANVYPGSFNDVS